MKRAYWAGAVLVLGFLVLGLSTFSRSMTPYVSFAEAKAAPRTVQVMGALEKGTTRYDTEHEDAPLHASRPEDATSRFPSPTRT